MPSCTVKSCSIVFVVILTLFRFLNASNILEDLSTLCVTLERVLENDFRHMMFNILTKNVTEEEGDQNNKGKLI